MVKVDNRDKAQLTAQMVERSQSYTPEWIMDPDNPDIAAALALAYADMLAGTLKKLNGTLLKNQIAFFNTGNITQFPASPSNGYVSFTLSADDVGGTPISKGCVLSANSGGTDIIRFETCDDILVSPAAITRIFCADDREDYIGQYEDFRTEKTALFDLSPVNLQSHVLHIAHPFVFNIRTEGELHLSFSRKGDTPVEAQYMQALADPSAAQIEYYAGETHGYVPFLEVRTEEDGLILVKDPSLPPVTADPEGWNLRITARQMAQLRDFTFTMLRAGAVGKTISPDHVTNGVLEFDIHAFYPFGERFQLFNEVYFGCGEVLDKRGARITLSFDMSLMEIPIENQLDDESINWKWIARKEDFKEAKSFRISVTSVIWEYFNGSGWSRLFPDNANSDLFKMEQGVTSCFKSMTFVCPDDMTATFVGAHESFFIRARLLQAENLYKTKGWYMSPFLRNVSFDYAYEDGGCRIMEMQSCNNLAEQRYDPLSSAAAEGYAPFYCAGAEQRTVYLGFSAPPDSGPMRILWDLEEEPFSKHAKLEWRYLTSRGWRPMNLADETRSFTRTGLTVFLDNHHFKRTKLFGEELYWVSVTDAEDMYRNRLCGLPVIDRIYHNSVRAVNVDSHREETFAMTIYTENARFTLSEPSVLDFALYVNESATITEQEIRELEAQERILRINGGGMNTEIWVKWNEVLSFLTEDSHSRSYLLDRSSGVFTFGNGRKGRIPAASDLDNIRVIYTTGGGERSNVPAETITSLDRSYGFVSGVTNPRSFYGGSDIETVQQAMQRGAIMLRTQGKAVTARDLERLTFNASRDILKVRCISGRNASGSRQSGAVTLVVLKRKHSEFSRLRNDILQYLKGRIVGNLATDNNLYVVEPTFVRTSIRAEIRTDQINGVFELKKSIEQCLEDYFASFRGTDGDNNWRLGMIPNELQIRSALLRLKNVAYIRNLYITMYSSGSGGLKEIDIEALRQHSYILPLNGEHDITVTVE